MDSAASHQCWQKRFRSGSVWLPTDAVAMGSLRRVVLILLNFLLDSGSLAAENPTRRSHQQGVAALSVRFGGLRMIAHFWLQPAELPRLIRASALAGRAYLC